MQQKQAIVFEILVHNSHIRFVVLVPHVFEHAERHHVVVLPVYGSIILYLYRNRQSFAAFSRELRLFFRNRDSHGFDPVCLSRILHEAAPAAANIENRLSWLEPDLSADQIKLVLLKQL
jgi:hypothetical protein